MIDEASEARQDAAANDPAWVERYSLLGVTATGCVWSELAILAGEGIAQFRATLLRSDERPLVLLAEDLTLPSKGLEFRGSGIWVELVCETPLTHWSYGLEAFALALDSPTELAHTGMGNRAPLGWELEFETGGDESMTTHWGTGYTQHGELHGIVLTGDGQAPWSGPAIRGHSWGVEPAAPLQIQRVGGRPLGWVAVPGHQAVTVGEDPGGVSVI